MVILQIVMQHSGEGDFILFDKIPGSTIDLPLSRFQRSIKYPNPGSLLVSRINLRIKHS